MTSCPETFGQMQIQNKQMKKQISKLHTDNDRLQNHNTALLKLVEQMKKRLRQVDTD